jgi:hypothetical protein
MSVTAPPIVRIYEPLTLLVPTQGAGQMPQLDATMNSPPCLRHSHLPPSKTVWISTSDSETIGVVCGPCNELAGDELEKRILAKVSGEPATPKIDISQPPAAAEALPTWTHRGAAKWVEPLTRPPAA